MFYTYLWLREDGTPYYVGKGSGKRAYINNSHRVSCPRNVECIIVQEFDSEESSFEAEKFLISYYGRKDLSEGCLTNLTDGGENPPNHKGTKRSKETRRRISEGQMGNQHCLGRKTSQTTKLKIGKKLKNRIFSPSTRHKMSLAKMGNTNATGHTGFNGVRMVGELTNDSV